MVDIFYLKATRKKASDNTVVIRCFTEQCQELGHGQLRGISYCMCFYKGEKNKTIQPIPLEVDQKGWPCWVPCEASYVFLLQGDIAFHSSLTCLICLDWIPARRTKGKCEPNQFIWEE